MRHYLRWILPLLLLVGSLSLSGQPAQAAGVVGNGTPASCTEAALKAALVDGGTVTFNCGGDKTITLTSPIVLQGVNATIDGGNDITLDGNGGRVIEFTTWGYNAARKLNLRKLTITGGGTNGSQEDANGAALYIRNQSANFDDDIPTVNINLVTFSNNVANQTSNSGNPYDYGGGAIYILGGVLNVGYSTFEGNRANNGAGGAIHALGSNVSITNSAFTNNVATGNGPSSTNSGYGGVLYVDGALVRGNGRIQIQQSTFDGNQAANQGGVAYINLYASRNGAFAVSRSLFTNNTVSGGGMGLGGALSGGGTGGPVSMSILESLFANNSVEGGTRGGSGGALAFAQPAEVVIGNSTFTGNQAKGVCLDCYNANGGAIYVTNNPTPFEIINSTIANNDAGWVGGGIAGSSGILKNTIIANNTASNGGNPWEIQQHCSAELTNGGNNIQWPDKNPNPNYWNEVRCASGIIVADPLLGELEITQWWAGFLPLLSGSPAIDAGNNAVCAEAPIFNRDVRGGANGPRPINIVCDIGSYEVNPHDLETIHITAPSRSGLNPPAAITTLQWRKQPNAGYYHLDVVNPAGSKIFSGTVQQADCDGNTCSLDVNTNYVFGEYVVYMIPGVGPDLGIWRKSRFTVGLGSVKLSAPTGTVNPADNITVQWPKQQGAGYYVLDVYYPQDGFNKATDRITVNSGACSSNTCSAQIPTRGNLGTFSVWMIPGIGSKFGTWANSQFNVGLGPVTITAPDGPTPPAAKTSVEFATNHTADYIILDVYAPGSSTKTRYTKNMDTCTDICSVEIDTHYKLGDFTVWTIAGKGSDVFGPWKKNTVTVALADVTLTAPTGSTPLADNITLTFDMPEGAGYAVLDVYRPGVAYNRSTDRYIVPRNTCSGDVCSVEVPSQGRGGAWKVWAIPGLGPNYGTWKLNSFGVTTADEPLDTVQVDVMGAAAEPPALDIAPIEAPVDPPSF